MKKIIFLLITLLSIYVNIYSSTNSSTPVRTITWNEYLNIQTRSSIVGEDNKNLLIIYNGELIEVIINN